MKRSKVFWLSLCWLLILNLFITSGCGNANIGSRAKDYAIVDLHLHLDGSISPESARELAAMQSISLPESDEELKQMLQVDDDCKDLNEYLEKFALTVSLLQTKEALSTAVYNLETELKELGLLYAEIRFAPQLHTQNGLTQAEIVEAAIEGTNRCDFRSTLILCCMRGDDNREQNLETVEVAKEFLGKGVSAIDIAGAEALFPTKDFEDIFLFATQLGVPFTIHAGEADGAASVRSALSFGAKRIGHGVRSAEDEELIKFLAKEGIVLELCPTSNMNTNVFDSLSEYPLLKFLEAGVKVTVNSDNMVVSDTNVQAEYQKMIDTFDLTDDQLKTLVENAIDASYADAETKSWLRSELEKRIGN